MKLVTCIAPVNIAVIKYWGKRDENLILPLNDSISVTLSTQEMHAKTTIMASPDFKTDRMWLNGKEESMNNPRLQNCLREIRRLAETNEDITIPSVWCVHICSVNNFPTAAGLASSAAGYACLVYALAQIYGISSNISGIARQGSGSACRSLFGGFVRWHKGNKEDGSDSISTQIAPASHWPELRILVLVVSDKKKKISSTSGMQRSVKTSKLLKYRIQEVVPERVVDIEKAIVEKNFQSFAEITMKDSNSFHAVALDTYPPAVYMNDVSHSIAHVVHKYNTFKGENKVAYTFDAGPNACLYMLESVVTEVTSLLNTIFPPLQGLSNTVKGLPISYQPPTQDLLNNLDVDVQPKGQLQYIIQTTVGHGPQTVIDHLLDSSGNPKI